ncbi:LCP family protein (plasmid) [Deinococcus sp. KNUC1210]|uniref:LCP family protein n=1 Tax=Deinococcus sp. KNUC1210 TaxID=2917691 RepID=UPI001EF075A2|nr:LCP family protein [Deinococcus sp. KNUC1210]ULH13891.1 LCP family protein [Deinococcus sp. KNUC1210]
MRGVRRNIVLGVCLLGVLGGAYLYRDHQQVQQLGVKVYKEFDHDGLPVPAGVLDDPVFAHLPPPTGPVSFGRYKPPKTTQAPAQVPQGQTSQPQTLPTQSLPSAIPPVVSSAVAVQPSPVQPGGSASSNPVPSPTGSVPAQKPAAQQPPAVLSFTQRLSTLQPLHLLLIGTDQEELDRGRADVLMVVTVDAKRRQLLLLSIPRDTRITLPGRGEVKINAAYAYGGAGLQTAAVERFLGIPMDKIVEVSLAGFRQAIDAVGGVQVDPSMAFSLDGQTFQPGTVKLSGVEALAYSRMRHDDPQGDLGRNTRQQEVIRSLIAALGKLPGSDFLKVLNTLQGTLRTNFSPSEVVRLRTDRPYILDTQVRVNVAGSNQRIGGIWYYIVSDKERQRLHLLLR